MRLGQGDCDCMSVSELQINSLTLYSTPSGNQISVHAADTALNRQKNSQRLDSSLFHVLFSFIHPQTGADPREGRGADCSPDGCWPKK